MGVWFGLGLWLWHGGTMSTQPADLPTTVHTTRPARTIHDVEAELMLAWEALALERATYARRFPTKTNAHLADDTLPEVRDVNALLDEWTWWHN